MSAIDWQALRLQLAETEARLAEKASRAPEHWQELLGQRARQLQQRRPSQLSETRNYLAVSLGSEELLLPIQALRSVERFDCCEPLPLAPPELLGICHQRGRMVSIVELARLLDIRGDEAAGYVLFVRTQPELGLRVANLTELLPLAPEALRPAEAGSYFSAFEPAGRPILDLRSLLQHPFLASTHFSKELTP